MSHSSYRKSLPLLILLFSLFLFVIIMLPGCSGGGGGGGSSDYTTVQPSVVPDNSDNSTLEYDTTYYWQVEACSNDGRKSPGTIWSFTTTAKDNKTFSAPVTFDTAKTVALSHIKSLKGRPEFSSCYSSQLEKFNDDSIVSIDEITDENASTLAYIVHLKPVGYIVVPATTSLSPVLAYSLNSNFSKEDNSDNVLLDMLKEDLKLRNKALKEKGFSETVALRNQSLWLQYIKGSFYNSEKSGSVWGPHITFTTWNQGAPYNNLCPVDPRTGNRSQVGCVAVAMAQLMTFWQYPQNIELTSADNYITRTGKILIDASAANLPSIDYNNGSPDENALAGLCLATGILIETDFVDGGSGADFYTSYLAIRDRLGFREAICDTYISTGFIPANLINEIKAGRPSVLCITSENGAHSVDVDGYDEETGAFHLNFGWGGQNDGWYSLPQGMPGYSVVEAAIIHISPDPVNIVQVTPYTPFPADNSYDISPNVTLKWNCTGWDYYNIYIWSSQQSKPSVPTISNLTNTFFKP